MPVPRETIAMTNLCWSADGFEEWRSLRSTAASTRCAIVASIRSTKDSTSSGLVVRSELTPGRHGGGEISPELVATVAHVQGP
jgi:hypothetical protein